MRPRLVLAAALCGLIASDASARAAERPAPLMRAAGCATSVAFGEPTLHESRFEFRATVTVACRTGVVFSAALRSANACELRSPGGGSMRYELFSDASMQAAVVSCDGTTEPLHGTGRQTFVVYGRTNGTGHLPGEFTDALLATISL